MFSDNEEFVNQVKEELFNDKVPKNIDNIL